VLALLIGVLLIIQGLLGIVAPDAFVGVVRFFQTPFHDLRRGSLAHRHRNCFILRGN
jgi:hypothetical protein